MGWEEGLEKTKHHLFLFHLAVNHYDRAVTSQQSIYCKHRKQSPQLLCPPLPNKVEHGIELADVQRRTSGRQIDPKDAGGCVVYAVYH